MKKGFILLAFIGLFMSCENNQTKEVQNNEQEVQQTSQERTMVTRFEALKGYFVKSNVVFEDDYKYVVSSNMTDFENYFGIAKTMNNEVTALDFEKFNVAAIIIKPSSKLREIKVEKDTSKDGITLVGFSVEEGEERDFSASSLLLFKIPKSITNVNFETADIIVNIEVK